jgi:hypothetical protein
MGKTRRAFMKILTGIAALALTLLMLTVGNSSGQSTQNEFAGTINQMGALLLADGSFSPFSLKLEEFPAERFFINDEDAVKWGLLLVRGSWKMANPDAEGQWKVKLVTREIEGKKWVSLLERLEPKEPETLRTEVPTTESGVPQVEQKVIQEIKDKGAGNRFVIKEIKPAKSDSTVSLTLTGYWKQQGPMRFYDRNVLAEFPGDNPLFGISGSDIIPAMGNGSVHRFDGELKMFGYTFIGEGDRLNRLTFAILDGVGYVYLRGKGRVLAKDGKEYKLGY